MGENFIRDKSKAFALRTIRLYQYLSNQKCEYVMSKQLLRSGTSIGANVREAQNAQSKKEFVAKMNISLKEAAESEYWLKLLYKAEYVSEKDVHFLIETCRELERMLISTLKTAKSNKE